MSAHIITVRCVNSCDGTDIEIIAHPPGENITTNGYICARGCINVFGHTLASVQYIPAGHMVLFVLIVRTRELIDRPKLTG